MVLVWNCVNDELSRLCAAVWFIWLIRLIVMLYDGWNDECSGYVCVDVKFVICVGLMFGVYTIMVWFLMLILCWPAWSVSWVYFFGVMLTCVLLLNLVSCLSMMVRVGMLMFNASVLVVKMVCINLCMNSCFIVFLKIGISLVWCVVMLRCSASCYF